MSVVCLYLTKVTVCSLLQLVRIMTRNKQVLQLSQRDRAAEWASYGQKWKTTTGRQYFTDIIGLSSTTVT